MTRNGNTTYLDQVPKHLKGPEPLLPGDPSAFTI